MFLDPNEFHESVRGGGNALGLLPRAMALALAMGVHACS